MKHANADSSGVRGDKDVPWRGYLVRSVILWISIIFFVPGIVLLFSLARVDWATIALTLIWFVGIAGAGSWQSAWLCPRCRHSFQGEGNWGYSGKCSSCGLKAWEGRPPAGQ